MATTDLGKVGMLLKGVWNSAVAYEKLDIVSSNGNSYAAKQNVPAGTPLSNTAYWQVITDVSAAVSAANTATSNANAAASSANGIYQTVRQAYENGDFDGHLLMATFEVDADTMNLQMYSPDEYEGINFQLTDNGYMEVTINANN